MHFVKINLFCFIDKRCLPFTDERETKIRDMEDPDIDISIEEIRKRIREEKEAAEEGAQESQRLDESTDSDFTITYEEAPTSPNQDTKGEEVRAEDGEAGGGKAKRLSPRQRLRRQSLARNKKKQWGQEWMMQL